MATAIRVILRIGNYPLIGTIVNIAEINFGQSPQQCGDWLDFLRRLMIQ